AIARRADHPDPWRDQGRDAEVWQNRQALQRVADSPDVEGPPPTLLAVLGTLVERSGGDAVILLERAEQRHPGDFWLNFEVANALQQERRGRWEEAVGYYRAALGVRPKSSVVYNNLGATLCDKKRDHDGAIACFRRAIAIDPKLALAHYN